MEMGKIKQITFLPKSMGRRHFQNRKARFLRHFLPLSINYHTRVMQREILKVNYTNVFKRQAQYIETKL